jgi:hypothetical protein
MNKRQKKIMVLLLEECYLAGKKMGETMSKIKSFDDITSDTLKVENFSMWKKRNNKTINNILNNKA